MHILEYCQQLNSAKKSFAFVYQIRKDNMENEIIEKTKFLNDSRLSARVFCILNSITEHPRCECGKPLQFNQFSLGFRDFCSVKCSSNSISKQEKIKETNLLKYGCTNSFQTDIGRKKWNEFQNDVTRVKQSIKKTKQTLKNNYGVETIEEAQKLRTTAAIEAKIEKYGYNFNNREKAQLSRDEVKMVENLEKACIQKYGVRHAMHSSETFKKCMKNSMKRKDYIFPSGRIDKVQGYEPLALNMLLNNYTENEIITDNKEMPIFSYIGTDGKEHKYYPDIYIKKDNLIIEVKSDYTMKVSFETNKLKEAACLSMGFKFNFMIFDKKGILID